MSVSKVDPSSASLGSPGKCVVCGKESQLRCSACLSHGLNWMFFCSKDHQKLIWPFHKRVCGPLAKPFYWPSFTKSELEEYLELIAKPFKGRDGVTKEISDIIGNVYPTETFPDQYLAFLEYLLRCLEPDDGSPLSPVYAPLVPTYRTTAWTSRLVLATNTGRMFTFEEQLDMMVDHPFDFLAHVQQDLRKKLKETYKDELPTWWNDLQHKSVHLLAINCLIRKDKVAGVISSTSVDLVNYRKYAHNELMSYCKDVIRPADEDMANRIEADLMPWLRPVL